MKLYIIIVCRQDGIQHPLQRRLPTRPATKTFAYKTGYNTRYKDVCPQHGYNTRYKDICPQDGVRHPLQRHLPTTRVQHRLQRHLPTRRGTTPATKTSAHKTGYNTRYEDVCPQDGEQHPLQRRLPTRRGTTPATKTFAHKTGYNIYIVSMARQGSAGQERRLERSISN